MPYTFALFDADHTLFDFARAEREAVSACLAARGLPSDDRTIRLYSDINVGYWKMLERGEITRDALKIARFQSLFDELGCKDDAADIAIDYENNLAKQMFLIDGAEELLASLHGRCQIYIITNGTATVQRPRLSRSPLTPYFDGCFISEEMGASKPDRAFFEQVAAAIPNFEPRKALVIGDSLTSDIQGGINMGWDTCWYNPYGLPIPDGMPITYVANNFEAIHNILTR